MAWHAWHGTRVTHCPRPRDVTWPVLARLFFPARAGDVRRLGAWCRSWCRLSAAVLARTCERRLVPGRGPSPHTAPPTWGPRYPSQATKKVNKCLLEFLNLDINIVIRRRCLLCPCWMCLNKLSQPELPQKMMGWKLTYPCVWKDGSRIQWKTPSQNAVYLSQFQCQNWGILNVCINCLLSVTQLAIFRFLFSCGGQWLW